MIMKNYDLNEINGDHVKGHWQVHKRVFNKPDHDYFTDINKLDLEKSSFRSINGKVIEGQWEVFREKELIFNPQIKFYHNKIEIGNAIITRLYEEQTEGQKSQKLTLYFLTGLELILKKEEL